MINLYTWPTPNGRKVSILLEEIGIPYKVFAIDITKEEQFSKEFSIISPSNKIPAIVDTENNKSIFEMNSMLVFIVTMAAALPSGSQSYYFSYRYNSLQNILSANIVFSTLVSFFTLSLLLIIFKL